MAKLPTPPKSPSDNVPSWESPSAGFPQFVFEGKGWRRRTPSDKLSDFKFIPYPKPIFIGVNWHNGYFKKRSAGEAPYDTLGDWKTNPWMYWFYSASPVAHPDLSEAGKDINQYDSILRQKAIADTARTNPAQAKEIEDGLYPFVFVYTSYKIGSNQGKNGKWQKVWGKLYGKATKNKLAIVEFEVFDNDFSKISWLVNPMKTLLAGLQIGVCPVVNNPYVQAGTTFATEVPNAASQGIGTGAKIIGMICNRPTSAPPPPPAPPQGINPLIIGAGIGLLLLALS